MTCRYFRWRSEPAWRGFRKASECGAGDATDKGDHLKTAKALELKLPQSLLVVAGELIE